MAISSQHQSSLIQGISQQADSSRGTASAEDQYNCLNEVLDGVVSRMGSSVVGAFARSYGDPFVHRAVRSGDERYLFVVEDGQLTIINEASGALCTVSGSIAAYLAHEGVARKAFQAVSVGDTTFLLNRERPVSMGTARSPVRPNWGCAHFRAGAYSTRYTLSITVAGTTYTATAATPDNSIEFNAAFIQTRHLASLIHNALTGTVFPTILSEKNLSFSSSLHASTVVIVGPAGVQFGLDTADGTGGQQFRCFVDEVRTLDDIPSACRAGYVLAVSPQGGMAKERYWLQYSGSSTTGRWDEVVKPDTPLGLDGSTMPHLLVNTGLNTFEVKPGAWGVRVAGDGQNSAQDPSFVGRSIRSLQFIGGRLACISEYTAVLSKARNAYVFFPDTLQTALDTAPIDYDVSNGSSTLIEHCLTAGSKLQFWGDSQQTYLETGDEALKEETTAILPLSNYEYDGECPPQAIGMASLMFGSSVADWTQITEIFLRGATFQGEIAITAHVPKLLTGTLRNLAVGQAAGTAVGKALAISSGDLTRAYLYQWYNNGTDRVQSAWNKWTFPAVNKLLWVGIYRGSAYLLIQWPESRVTLEAIRLDSTGSETTQAFPLRLDHLVTDEHASWNAAQGYWEVSLPYSVTEARRGLFSCWVRLDGSGVRRGRRASFSWVNSRTIRVSAPSFSFGVIPAARRRFSRIYARDEQGQPVVHDKLLVKKIVVSHKGTADYLARLHKVDGTVQEQRYLSRTLGDPTLTNEQVAIKTGSFTVDVNSETEDTDVELVNDTPFPAVWTGAKIIYDLTTRIA